jgi:DNA-binding FadR family transcriptional regulator
MAIDYEGLETQGLARQIADKIRSAILEGRLKVDERLPTEEDLAARFKVSRATIREALKRLAAHHLIRSRRGPTGGNFVNPPSQDDTRSMVANATALLVAMGEFSLDEVAEARQELELACCRLAATRALASHLEAMAEEIAHQQDPTLSDEEFCASDVRFHRTLVAAAANPALEFSAAGLIDSLQPATNLVVFRFRDRTEVAAQHAAIHRALVDRDANAAGAALSEYMRTLRRQYEQARAARDQRLGDPQ